MPTESHTILARRPEESFIGRTDELNRILSAAEGSLGAALHLTYAPRAGATELLLQSYDRIFRQQASIVPVYFSLKSSETALEAGRRFLIELLTQLTAFRRNEPALLFATPSISEMQRSASPIDSLFVEELVRLIREEVDPDEEEFYVRNCFGMPLRARSVKMFVMIDHLHETAVMSGGKTLRDVFLMLSRQPDPRMCFASYRRFRFEAPNVQGHAMPQLSSGDVTALIGNRCADAGVPLADAVRDLIAFKTGGDLTIVHGLVSAAARASMPLDTFQGAANIYTASVFGGTIGSIYDRILADVSRSMGAEKGIVRLLHESKNAEGNRLSAEVWQKHLGIGEREARELLSRMNLYELIRSSGDRIEPMAENTCLADYVSMRYRIEISGENRAPAFAASLASFMAEAPQIMAEEYRRASSVGLRELLARFDAKAVPSALFNYDSFKYRYKGIDPEEVERMLRDDTATIDLPRIVFSAHTESFYKAIGLITERERSAVAVGFEHGEIESENRIAWIAAEIDSKMEVTPDLANFWCDRLEMAAVMCGFGKYRLWLVSPEGFSADALDVLAKRECYSSSRRQVELLKGHLDAEMQGSEEPAVEEYEIVIPMGGDTEMVSAHALEDIAKRHNFNAQEINQIKTALIEACINASEHSHSLDGRIHQRFVVRPDRITITVSNRGLRLTDRLKATVDEPEDGRRGWGLKLMRKLMDDVLIEHVDDGTRISMTKYLQAA